MGLQSILVIIESEFSLYAPPNDTQRNIPGHAPVAAFLNLTAGSRASLFEFANLARLFRLALWATNVAKLHTLGGANRKAISL